MELMSASLISPMVTSKLQRGKQTNECSMEKEEAVPTSIYAIERRESFSRNTITMERNKLIGIGRNFCTEYGTGSIFLDSSRLPFLSDGSWSYRRWNCLALADRANGITVFCLQSWHGSLDELEH